MEHIDYQISPILIFCACWILFPFINVPFWEFKSWRVSPPAVLTILACFLDIKPSSGKEKSPFLPIVISVPEINSCIIAETVKTKKREKLSYSIVIPAYNEEGNIKFCIKRIPDLKRDYEIIVVNDGSNDRTMERVRELIKDNKKIKLIGYKQNMGKGYATKKGMDAAQKDVIMILDADMTVKPEDLTSFLDPFEKAFKDFKLTDIYYSERMHDEKRNNKIVLVNIKHAKENLCEK